ncbi:MAG: lytic transglycosylase, partial [Phenylobacterium zucineum]
MLTALASLVPTIPGTSLTAAALPAPVAVATGNTGPSSTDT